VLGDKVVGEGYVTVAALYVARTEGQPLHYVSWRRAMAFESEIDVPGAQPGMDADVSARVASIAADLLNRETVEADVRLTFEAAVTRPVEREAIVEAVAVPPAEGNPPTFTFVAVQPGDTLWKLSNRYHANMDDIVRANPWLQGAADGALPAGRKRRVPRPRPQAPPTPLARRPRSWPGPVLGGVGPRVGMGRPLVPRRARSDGEVDKLLQAGGHRFGQELAPRLFVGELHGFPPNGAARDEAR